MRFFTHLGSDLSTAKRELELRWREYLAWFPEWPLPLEIKRGGLIAGGGAGLLGSLRGKGGAGAAAKAQGGGGHPAGSLAARGGPESVGGLGPNGLDQRSVLEGRAHGEAKRRARELSPKHAKAFLANPRSGRGVQVAKGGQE